MRNIGEFDGRTIETGPKTFTDWCSDGKYRRTENTKYTINNSENGISIKEKYSYYDDDGQTGEYTREYGSGRDIINIINKFF